MFSCIYSNRNEIWCLINDEIFIYDYFQQSRNEKQAAIRKKELAVKAEDYDAYYEMVKQRKEEAEKRFEAWVANKQKGVEAIKAQLSAAKVEDVKKRLEAEKAVNAAKAEEVSKKRAEKAAELAAAAAEAAAEEAPATEEAPAAE